MTPIEPEPVPPAAVAITKIASAVATSPESRMVEIIFFESFLACSAPLALILPAPLPRNSSELPIRMVWSEV